MHYRGPRQAFSLATFAASITILACASARAAQTVGAAQPVILRNTGKGLQPRIDRLEMLAFHAGTSEPIPFQVDSVVDDSLVLTSGPYASPKSPEVLSAGDEIVIMDSDFGERASRGNDLPAHCAEIQFTEANGGTSRYAYLAEVANPRLSPHRYVSYDPATETIETDHYRMGLANGLPSDFAFQDRMGEHRPNMIDRFKVRLSTRVMHIARVSFSEDDIQTRVLAWKAGPVRVFRWLAHSIKIAPGLQMVLDRQDFFYRDSVDNPFDMTMPWAARIFFAESKLRIDLDFMDLSGYQLLWSQMSDPPLKIGDRSAETKVEELPPDQVFWIAVSGKGRSAVQTLAQTPDLHLLKPQLYFNDDPDRPDPPEHVIGEHPGIGYSITGWENLERGPHFFDSGLIILQGDRDPASVVNDINARPSITLHKVEK